MFGIDSSELLIIAVVAVVVIGPKDLPRVLYQIGKVVGQARAMSRHFRSGLDAMIREAELEEMQKQWDRDNARIMAEHPVSEPVMTGKPLVDGAHEEAAPEQAAPADPLVEAVKASQTPAPDVPAAEALPSKDAAA